MGSVHFRLGSARFAGAALLILAIAACGGGGGGTDTNPAPSNLRSPLPRLVQDIEPSGTRTDVAAQDFFVLSAGDRARYSAFTRAGRPLEVERQVSTGPDAEGRVTVRVRESVVGQSDIEPLEEEWRLRPEGLLGVNLLGDDASASVKALVGEMLLYPTPFYPAGSNRTLIRQGNLDVDLDGDKVSESFRLEFRQEFVGFEAGTRAGRQEQRARFKNRLLLSIEPSRLDLRPSTIQLDEEIVFAAHTGIISAKRTEFTNGAETGDYRGLDSLIGGTLAGRDANTAWNGGSTRYVPLVHNALIYEPVQGFYYASVKDLDPRSPGTVARIDPGTGATAYSEALGGDVGHIAASADGSTLYAAVFKRAEIVRLSLPDLQVRQRIPLPAGSSPFALAVSPLDAGTLAFIPGGFGTFSLMRNGVVQPRRVDFFALRIETTNVPVLFSADGSQLFVYGVALGVEGVARLPVLADGLGDPAGAVPYQGGNQGMSLSLSPGGIVAGAGLYRPADLQLIGRVENDTGGGCRPLRDSTRWVCLPSLLEGWKVNVMDSASFARINDGVIPVPATLASTSGGSLARLVPGPRGQVGISASSGSAGPLGGVVLFDNPDFR